MDVYAGRILSHAAFTASGRALKRLSEAHPNDAGVAKALRAWEAHRQEIHRAGLHVEGFA